ncbi:hypothetical protein BB560_002101, partial [Smittium megazygosporum]
MSAHNYHEEFSNPPPVVETPDTPQPEEDLLLSIQKNIQALNEQLARLNASGSIKNSKAKKTYSQLEKSLKNVESQLPLPEKNFYPEYENVAQIPKVANSPVDPYENLSALRQELFTPTTADEDKVYQKHKKSALKHLDAIEKHTKRHQLVTSSNPNITSRHEKAAAKHREALDAHLNFMRSHLSKDEGASETPAVVDETSSNRSHETTGSPESGSHHHHHHNRHRDFGHRHKHNHKHSHSGRKSARSKRRSESRPEDASDDKAFINIVCDACNSRVYPLRWKCVVCKDYDECQDCHSSLFRVKHEHVLAALPTFEVDANPNDNTLFYSPKEDRCNTCAKPIDGIKWNCGVCSNFNICGLCKIKSGNSHPDQLGKDHELTAYYNVVSSSMDPTKSRRNNENTLNCDGCKEIITGESYKCDLCSDFDLCGNCIQRANEIHPCHDQFVLFNPDPSKIYYFAPKNTSGMYPIQICPPFFPEQQEQGPSCGVGEKQTETDSNVPLEPISNQPCGPGSFGNQPKQETCSQASGPRTRCSFAGGFHPGRGSFHDRRKAFRNVVESTLANPQVQGAFNWGKDFFNPERYRYSRCNRNYNSCADHSATSDPSSIHVSLDKNNTRVYHETSEPKYSACFVEDITIPDGTRVPPGESFVKIWSVANVGDSSWPQGAKLVFLGGDNMYVDNNFEVPVIVASNYEKVGIAVDIKAPMLPGRHRSKWRLCAPDGCLFGDELWCDIFVESLGEDASTQEPTSGPQDRSIPNVPGDYSQQTRYEFPNASYPSNTNNTQGSGGQYQPYTYSGGSTNSGNTFFDNRIISEYSSVITNSLIPIVREVTEASLQAVQDIISKGVMAHQNYRESSVPQDSGSSGQKDFQSSGTGMEPAEPVEQQRSEKFEETQKTDSVKSSSTNISGDANSLGKTVMRDPTPTFEKTDNRVESVPDDNATSSPASSAFTFLNDQITAQLAESARTDISQLQNDSNKTFTEKDTTTDLPKTDSSNKEQNKVLKDIDISIQPEQNKGLSKTSSSTNITHDKNNWVPGAFLAGEFKNAEFSGLVSNTSEPAKIDSSATEDKSGELKQYPEIWKPESSTNPGSSFEPSNQSALSNYSEIMSDLDRKISGEFSTDGSLSSFSSLNDNSGKSTQVEDTFREISIHSPVQTTETINNESVNADSESSPKKKKKYTSDDEGCSSGCCSASEDEEFEMVYSINEKLED